MKQSRIWNFFKKSQSKTESKGLARAKELDLITEEELLKLALDRAEKNYKDYLAQAKIKKR